MTANETGPLSMAPLPHTPCAKRSLDHSHDDPIDLALAAIGYAIDIRDVVRRLDELLDGAP
jgi:hypothetical protein